MYTKYSLPTTRIPVRIPKGVNIRLLNNNNNNNILNIHMRI